RRPTRYADPYGLSVDATGTLGSAAFSQMTKSSGYLVDLAHWPPMIGVVTAFATGPLVQSRSPSGVVTLSVFIASATFVLLLGSPLAFSAAAATSKSARLAPSCWFHCLPLACS